MLNNSEYSNVAIFEKSNSNDDDIQGYRFAFGRELGAKLDYIIDVNNYDEKEQIDLIDQLIEDGINHCFEAVYEERDDKCSEFMNSIYDKEIEKIDDILGPVDPNFHEYLNVLRKCKYGSTFKEDEFFEYRKYYQKEKFILGYDLRLRNDLMDKVSIMTCIIGKSYDYSDAEILEIAIKDAIERLDAKTRQVDAEGLCPEMDSVQ